MHSNEDLAALAVELIAAGSHFTRAAYQASGMELSNVSMRVLAALEREPGLRIGELAAREGIRQPSMSQAMKRLVDDGYAARHTVDDDARATALTITDAGREALHNYRTAAAEAVAPVFETLKPEDVATLQRAAELLPELTEELRQREGGRA